jgi:hypothetical protein
VIHELEMHMRLAGVAGIAEELAAAHPLIGPDGRRPAAGMATQNERGALSLAHRKGELKAGRDTLLRLLVRAGIALTEDDRRRIPREA